MSVSDILNSVLQKVKWSLNMQIGCTLTGVEPEWLVLHCLRPETRWPHVVAAEAADAAMRFTRAL